MAKIRTLPDKFYDKDYENNGIHRVPLWRIGCFALNNTATNLYMFMLMYLSYYLMGFVGVGMVVASSFSMVIGSVGGIITNLALGALWLFGDPTTMTSNPATGAFNWGYFLILHLVLTIIQGGFQGISGNIVIPMTADCADYEVYRTGRYVPGLMGTLFSFVDKIISSLAPMIAGLVFAACGFTGHNPVMGDVATPQLRPGVVFLAYGIIILGLICNLIAMKFYPLTKEKMAELQNEIVAIKERTMAENQA